MAEKGQIDETCSTAVAETSPPDADAALKTGGPQAEAQGQEQTTAESPPTQPPASVDASTQTDAGSAPAPVSQEPASPQPALSAEPTRTGTTTEETEAALNRIDADLADLESLLAQTSADGSSLPDNLTQAPPPPPEPAQTAEPPADTTPETTSEPVTDTPADESAPEENQAEQQIEATNEAADLLGYDSGGPVPDLSDGTEDSSKGQTPTAAPADAPVAAADEVAPVPIDNSLAGMFEQLLASTVLLPLFLMDKPFARLSLRVKTLMGVAGVATFLVAVATWIIGSFK